MYLYHWTTVIAVLSGLVGAQDLPLLSTIATIPELQTFSSVVNASGGSQLNPALEERFNSVLDGRNYTALAPTNDAFAKISPSLVAALVAAPAYPIFESIIRTHIAEGLVTSANIIDASPVEAIEGFPLTAATAGDAVFVNNQAEIVAVDTFAANGVVHQIDQVLNPFTAYFGVSNITTAPQTSTAEGSTISDILLTDSRLTDVRDVLLALQPDFVRNRLAFAGSAPQIFAAPSKDAFAAAPPDTAGASRAPSNQPLSFQLFSFGLIDTGGATFADLDLATGSVSAANVFTGINVTASQGPDGAVFLNNAGIQEEVCGSNGCVWIVDRVLDPLYLSFGPLDRAGG